MESVEHSFGVGHANPSGHLGGATPMGKQGVNGFEFGLLEAFRVRTAHKRKHDVAAIDLVHDAARVPRHSKLIHLCVERLMLQFPGRTQVGFGYNSLDMAQGKGSLWA